MDATFQEKYPQISCCADWKYLKENLSDRELQMIENIIAAMGWKIALIIPRNTDGEIDFDGEFKVEIKDESYQSNGYEELVLKWYESLEDTGYLVESIEGILL